MTRKLLALFAILVLSSLAIPYAVAEEEEDEEDENGFGFGEREREREHEDEGGFASPYSGLILYVTIGAIVAAFAYTGFRIYRSRSLKKLQ